MHSRIVATLGLLVALIGAMLAGTPTLTATAATAGGSESFYDHASPGITRPDGGFFVDPATGKRMTWAVNAGPVAHFVVSTVDATPNTVVVDIALPTGTNGSQSTLLAPDGSIYIGTYPQGKLFRWLPGSNSLIDLGTPFSAAYVYGLSAAPDGRVAFGTYQNQKDDPGKVGIYDPSSGFTLLGSAPPGHGALNAYVRSTAFDAAHNRVYFGTGTQDYAIYSVDLASKAMTLIVSAWVDADDRGDFALDLALRGSNRLLANLNRKLVAIDTATNRVITPTLPGGAASIPAQGRSFSPAQGGISYFDTDNPAVKGEKVLARYDLATDTVTLTSTVVDTTLGWAWLTVNGQPKLYMTAGNYGPDYQVYDPATGAVTTGQANIPLLDQPLTKTLAGPDGRYIYTSAYLNGGTAVLDSATGTFTSTYRLGQVEQWITDGADIYAGTYPWARLSKLTPSSGQAPKALTPDGDHSATQGSRPWALLKVGTTMYVGTNPPYGQLGGFIYSVDLTNPSAPPVSTRNIVADQSVSALALLPNGHLLVGTSTDGEGGKPGTTTQGQLLEWDPATRTVVRTILSAPTAVNAMLADGSTILVLAGATLYRYTPATGTATAVVNFGGSNCGSGSAGEIKKHPYNGLLYVNCGKAIYEVSGSTATQLPLRGPAEGLSVGLDGDLYYVTAGNPANPGWYNAVGRWHPNPPSTSACSGTAQLYGVVNQADGDHLTWTLVDPRTNRSTGGTPFTSGVLPFTVKTFAVHNVNTLFATSTTGALYQINIRTVSTSLGVADVTLLQSSGWSLMTRLTSDGTYLYGTAESGNLYRYAVTVAKPASTVSLPGTLLASGVTLQTLAAEAPGQLIGTTAAGELVGYRVSGSTATRATLRASTWTFDGLAAVGGLLYAKKSGQLWGYRDQNATDQSGADIRSLGAVTLRGWTQTQLAAVPGAVTC